MAKNSLVMVNSITCSARSRMSWYSSVLLLTAAGWCSKRWWRSHADNQSRCFSREAVPACKTPWRNFCKSRRKIYLSRLQELSRAGKTNAVNGRKVLCHDKIVEVACKNCDKLIAPHPLVSCRAC